MISRATRTASHTSNDRGGTTCEGPARRLVQRIAELGEEFEGADLGASFGVASFEQLPNRPEVMLEQADRALHEAKAAGKGQVVWREAPAGETDGGLSAVGQ